MDKPIEQMTMEELEVALDEDIEKVLEAACDAWDEAACYAWNDCTPLFGFVHPVPNQFFPPARDDGKEVGCLTLIRARDAVAYWPEMTLAIRRDTRIPVDGERMDVTPELLEVFKEWQLRIHERRLQDLHETVEIA